MSESEHARNKADQLLVDAMLRGGKLDTNESLDLRMGRVHEEISNDADQYQHRPVVSSQSGGGRNWNTVFRAALGGVTAIAAVLMVAVLLQTSPVSATDLLERAHKVELTSATGDHRYMVTISPPHQRSQHPELQGVLDVRDGKHMRFDLTQPNGTHHIWGFGPEGPWQLTPRGHVVRDRAARCPRWLLGESRSLLIDTMPGLLDLVLTGYDATSTKDENGLTQIIATQRDAAEGGPDEIVIELDGEQNEVVALELRWSPDSEERWRRMHGGAGQRSDASTDGRRRGDPSSRDRKRKAIAESEGAQSPPFGRSQDARHRPGHPGDRPGRRGGENGKDKEMNRSMAAEKATHERLERRRESMREKFRRPGGPPVPSAIRFQRVPNAEFISDDWYSGPQAPVSEKETK